MICCYRFKGGFNSQNLNYQIEAQNKLTEIQISRFRRIVEEYRRGGLFTVMVYVSNSAGILRSGTWDFDAVSAGIIVSPFDYRGANRTPDMKISTQPLL